MNRGSEEQKMRVMYIAPRMHPNQCPILSGWIKGKNEVCFLAQHKGYVEDHSVIRPIILGMSRKSTYLVNFYHIFSDGDLQHDAHFRNKNALPPVRKFIAQLNSFKPDIIIVRDRSLYMLICYWIAHLRKVPVILYNQSPLYSFEKRSLKRVMFDRLFPKYRMTPVWQRGDYHEREEWIKNGNKESDSFFVPFVMEPHCSPDKRDFFLKNQVNILEVGRYEKRKNHFYLIKTVKKIVDENPEIKLHLRIVGECANNQQLKYKSELKKEIIQNNLENYVDLLENLNTDQMADEYRKADLFVLPSSGEPAAISPLEAMSYSVACISGDDNGTADYIVPGKTGEIFHDQNWDEMYIKIKELVFNHDKLKAMGTAAYWDIKENYCFEKYQASILSILDEYKK